jgi:hypothetical protein
MKINRRNNHMKVKPTRKFATKKYTFEDENGKDVEVEFKFFALSTKQSVRFSELDEDGRMKTVPELFRENISGPEPYKTALVEYLNDEGNMYEEFYGFIEALGNSKENAKSA